MARTYRRDSNGRFSSTGGARSGRPAAKPVSRGKNRITRDNAGRIASVGGEGATARGGRLRTAAGNKRAVQTARIKGSGGRLRKPVGSGPRAGRTEPLVNGGTLALRSNPASQAGKRPPRRPSGPMSEIERQKLDQAKGSLEVSQKQLKAARSRKSSAKGPLEKLKAQDRISEYQQNVNTAKNRITLINARHSTGRPITGAGGWGERITAAKPRRTGAINRRIARDLSAAARAPKSLNLNAGQYRKLYAHNANKAAAAASRPRRR